MKHKIYFLLIVFLGLANVLFAQETVKQLEKWVQQQEEKFSSRDVVEFLNGGRAVGDITYGYNYRFNSTWSIYCSAITIDLTHFIIAFGDGSTQRGKAMVCTVYSGNALSFGPKYTFNYGSTEYISASMLDSSHFVITYQDKGNLDYGTSIIGTVSGTYLSFGSEFIFGSSWSNQFFSTAKLDNSHFLVSYQSYGNSYYGTSIIGNVSGTSITYSLEYIFNSGWTEECSSTTLDNSHFIISYRDHSNSNYGTSILGTINNGIITYGSEYFFNNASTDEISSTTLDNSQVLISYQDESNSNYGTAILASISGNQIIFGNEYIFNYESTYSINVTSLDSTHFVVSYREGSGNSQHGNAIVGSIAGSNITYGMESTFNPGVIYYNSVTGLDESHFAVAYERNVTSGQEGWAIVGVVEGDPITTSAMTTTTCPGTVTIPITVQNLDDVTQFSIILDYDTTNLTYTGFQNANTQLSSGTLTVTDNSGEISMAWNSITAANIASDTLLELNFAAYASNNQNIEDLTWDEINSYYLNSNGDSLSTAFNNGQVTIEPMVDSAGPITGSNNVCQGTTSESYQVSAIANATFYVWELNPANSGTINGSGTNITIDYSATFSGQTTLSVYGLNSCSNGYPSSLVITIAPGPMANANVDDTICANCTYTLSGLATNQQAILWTTSGDGTFDDATLLAATYTPGPAEIPYGSTTLTLTAYSTAPCTTNAVDDIVLTFQQLPTANAGSNDTIGDNATYTLSGSATNQQSILWSTNGNGIFDDATLLNATYTPGSNDIDQGSVILTLTAYAILPCITNATDSLILFIQPSQQIAFINGWNIMSFYLIPENIDLLNIVQPLIDSNELIKVVDEQGNFIQDIPGFGWMNTIGNMANTEGYYIKVNQNTQLNLLGTLVTTPFNIPLLTGWNIMGYPTQDTVNAITVLQPLIDSSYLTKVIDEAGGIIQEIPGSGWLNTIGNFEPGEGYYIKVNQNCTLTIGREPPTLTTDSVSNITSTSATSGGNITSDGGAPVTARGVCWSTSPNPTLANSYTTDGSGNGVFVSNISGLTPNTQYYVRAYATNVESTSYGNEITFTTSPPTLATVTTNSVTNITATTATSGGNVTSNGGATVTARGVCWSTSSNPTLANSYTTDGSGTGTFTSNLTGLNENSTYYVRAYATNSVGTVYGNEVSFVAMQPPPCNGNSTITYEGQTYNIIEIGTQCWMAENLNVGTRIDGVNNQTDNSTIEKYCYNDDISNCDTYGGLYQWDEMMQYSTTPGVQGICPDGWHLPTDDEWKTMEMALGMSQSEADAMYWRGTHNEGGKLKETGATHWWSPNTGATNTSGFTALPGGLRSDSGLFTNLRVDGYWWSSTEGYGARAWRRCLYYNNGQVLRSSDDKTFGRSVRCLKN